MSEQTFVAPAKKVTVRSFFLMWVEGVRLRPSTVESYRRNIEQHVLPEVGHLKLQSLTAAHLNALYGVWRNRDARATSGAERASALGRSATYTPSFGVP